MVLRPGPDAGRHRAGRSASRAAFGLARVLQSYLYQTTPTDPLTFAAVAVAFVVAGTLACLGPAWRATTVDPMMALRAD